MGWAVIRMAVVAVLGASRVVLACSSDRTSNGGSDAAVTGDGSAGSDAGVGAGGRVATGGTGTTGTGGRVGAGGAHAGGAPSTGGVADTVLPDGGTDASASGAADSGALDGSRGNVEGGEAGAHAAPCPIGSDFPVGTYHLRTIKSEYLGDFSMRSMICSVSRLGPTELTISVDPDAKRPYYAIAVGDQVFHLVQFVENGAGQAPGTLKASAQCPVEVCTYPSSIEVEIDKASGTVSSLKYNINYHPPNGDHWVTYTATGWLDCAASEASPPDWVSEPEPWGQGCRFKPTFECSSWELYGDLDSRPHCATQNPCGQVSPTTCEDTEVGLAALCCAP